MSKIAIPAKDIINEVLETYHIHDIMDSTTEFIVYLEYGKSDQVIITKIDNNTWQKILWFEGQEKKKCEILTSKEELLNVLSSSILCNFLFSNINEDFDTTEALNALLFEKATNLKRLITDEYFDEQFNMIAYKYNNKFKYLF